VASTDIGRQMLLCQVGSLVCGLPLEEVSETMRPLPVEPVAGMPLFVSGLSIVRGAPVPVVDLAMLLGDKSDAAKARWVVLKVRERKVALSVQGVLGIRRLDDSSVSELPPLLRDARAEFVGGIGSLDAQLLVVLESGRVLPNSVWAGLSDGGRQA
jgi:purine-binding chemotaxis protein CheW